MDIKNTLNHLKGVSDVAWGLYAFSRDVLKDKVGLSDQVSLSLAAIEDAEMQARKIRESVSSDPWEIAQSFSLSVTKSDNEMGRNGLLFALFTPPDKIEIMNEPLDRIFSDEYLSSAFDRKSLESLILSHELFHFVEEKDSQIFSRKTKVTNFRFFRFETKSTLRCLSELEAMYFAKFLTGFEYSPYILDIIAYYNYQEDVAEKLFNEITGYEEILKNLSI